nr:ribonuclease H-like domain, reverse transcriptase, RNA-dependent DNA polymerase [Tanacetum cinerariifolium]
MGELTFFLGLHVKQKPDGIFISQDKYVAEILRKFGLIDRKSTSTLIDTEKPLLKDPNGDDVDVHTYRSMIGSLMSTDKIKGLNAEAEGVSAAGETLSTATLAISAASVQPVLLCSFENHEAKMGMRKFFKCWFYHHTINGHQFTMSNRHQELASPKANGSW